MTTAVELLKNLVEIPSPSGKEEKILSYIEKLLEEKKFDFVLRQKNFVAGQLKASPKARQAIILSGHVDTVVPGAQEDWTYEPTRAVVQGGKIYGLGVSDMKAGVAGNLLTAFSLVEKEVSPDIWVVGTAREELDGQGSEDFAQWFVNNTHYESAFCIIAEPTDLEKIYIGQRGNHFMRLTFQGKAAHASNQIHFSESGLGKASKFLAAIDKIAESLAIYKNDRLGLPSFVATAVTAGDATSPNKTAAQAQVIVDCRLTPELEADFQNVMTALARQYHFTYEDVVKPVLSTLTDEETPIIKLLTELSAAKLTAAVGSNDQGFFEAVGIPTVVFGPGQHAQAHVVNESFVLKNLEQHVSLLCDFIEKL